MSGRRHDAAPVPTVAVVEEGSTDAPPLLLLHGVTRAGGDWSPVVPRLAGDWRVIAVDQRGHGLAPRAHRYLVVDYVADAAQLLRERVRQPAVILGHSLGAMVAAGVAAAVPELVRGVVLADPPFHTMGERIVGTAWEAQFAGIRAAAARGGSVEELAAALAAIRLPRPDGSTMRLGDLRSPQALQWHAACVANLDPLVLDPVIAGRWLEGYDRVSVAAAIQCPATLLQADTGAGGCLSDADRDSFVAGCRECVVERVVGAGHLLHWERPGRVCDAVARLAARAGRIAAFGQESPGGCHAP
jgi:pimeloyl-ACP methyl ester carboxylesterase